jgi:predicted anti-sigma-YlaC factor YlaD
VTCDEVRTSTPDYLTGELDAAAIAAILGHMAECASCRGELQGLSETWTRLRVLDDARPSPKLRARFYAMLEAYPRDAESQAPRPSSTPPAIRWWEWALRPMAAVLILAVGVALGAYVRGGRAGVPAGEETARMSTEIASLRQQVSLALINQSSAGERLRGVALVSQVQHPDPSLVNSLLDLVDNDPNVNVRLSAVEALFLFTPRVEIRERLTQSLAKQTSPVVQIAVIDLLVASREKQAAEALSRLIKDEHVRPEVREHAESGIKQLL